MVGLDESLSALQPTVEGPQCSNGAPDQPLRSIHIGQENPLDGRGSSPESPAKTDRRRRTGPPREVTRPHEDGSPPKECVTTRTSRQRTVTVEARLHRPGTGVSDDRRRRDHVSLRQKDDKISSLQDQVDDLERLSLDREDTWRTTRKELDDAKDHIAHQTRMLDESQRRCQQAEHELVKLRELLDHRTEEVKVAQAFMTTADKYSITEVCQMVEQLNDEIYQCSMNLSDAMVRQNLTPHGATPPGDAQHSFRRWNERVMARLVRDMRRRDGPDTTLFDCVSQSALVNWVQAIIMSFCPQNQEVNKYLSNLWEGVAASHETSIARNWLAITRATLKSQGEAFDRTSIIERLGHLMMLSGREALPRNRLEEVIGGKLEEIGKKALKIREAIAEGVLSADIQVFSPGINLNFDPLAMRDTFDNPRVNGRGSASAQIRGGIVCPTGLGLVQITRERRKSDPSQIRKKTEILLKAKVLLFSTLNG